MTQPIPGPLGVQTTPTNFVDLGDAISPTYLNGPVFAGYRLSMSIMLDALADGASIAVRARFPDTCPDDALVWISLDRLITQGFQENGTSFRARLKQWLDVLAYRGQPTGMLLAMAAFVIPTATKVVTVDNSSNWNTYAPSGVNAPVILATPSPNRASYPQGYPPGFVNVTPPAVQHGDSNGVANWKWDSAGPPFGFPFRWWRLWPIIFSVGGAPWATPSATWGSGLKWGAIPVGSGTCWGFAGTNSQALALTAIAKLMKAANVWVIFMIVSYVATEFDQLNSFGSGNLPDGHWGTWGKIVSDPVWGQIRVPARPPATTCSFIDGSGENP